MASDSPLVSVIIPTYNYSTVLRCAIESVLLQTIQDFELLVIGDGCTDDSEAVVRSFGDDRITWFNLPENTGNQGMPNNRGMAMAQGKYIAYLGHDDLWLPHHLDALTRTLEQHEMLATASLVLRFNHPATSSRHITNLNSDFAHFMPGVTMHRRDLRDDLRWKHYHELESDMTTGRDFSAQLLQRVGDQFMPTRQVTLLNFPSAYRPNSYRDKISIEQDYYIERIKDDPYIAQTLLLETIKLANAGLYQKQYIEWIGRRSHKSGEVVEAMRRLKGLEGDGRDIQSISIIDDPRQFKLFYQYGFASKLLRWVVYHWRQVWGVSWNPFHDDQSQVSNTSQHSDG